MSYNKETKFYNFFWNYDDSENKNKKQRTVTLHAFTSPLECKKHNIINIIPDIPAIILYPSLLTPAVVVGDENLDVIIAANPEDKLIKFNVNRQLKVSTSFEPKKIVKNTLLFYNANVKYDGKTGEENMYKKMTMTKIENYNDLITLGDKFSGLLSPQIIKMLEEKGLTDLYHINMPNLKYIADHKPKDIDEDGIEEVSDTAIKNALVNDDIGTKKENLFAYKFDDEYPETGKYDKENPIISYHPVFCYDKDFEYADIGFLSDMHLNARQEILKKSTAKVIEDKDSDCAPDIGKFIDVASWAFAEILEEMGNKADVLVVIGDIIDYNRNAATDKEFKKPSEIWDFVDLSDDTYKTDGRYQNGVDFTTFYTLIIDFYKRYKKPIFAVTGNHDFYQEPYGISPRLFGQRTNAGVPADHNLTIYEGILAFGPSFDEIKPGIPHSNFKEDTVKWFRFVLTPFSDFTAKLPKQHLVGLDWGNDEDLAGLTQRDNLLPGHLPRAKKCITDNQFKVLDAAIKDTSTKTIYFSHFTIISYKDSISSHTIDENGNVQLGKEGVVRYNDDYMADYNEYDHGTFDKNRKRFCEKYVRENAFQLMVTGHFHKSALYFMGSSSDGGYKSYYYEVEEYQRAISENKDINSPPILTAGANGPTVRANELNELLGQGCGTPTGTLVTVNKSNGEIEEISKIEATNKQAKPRFVVSLDYCDLLGTQKQEVTKTVATAGMPQLIKVEEDVNVNVMQKFKSDGFTINQIYKKQIKAFSFDIDLNCFLPKPFIGVELEDVVMFYLDEDSKEWKTFKLKITQDKTSWVIDELDKMKELNDLFGDDKEKLEKTFFLSLKFTCANAEIIKKYDFNSRWNFIAKLNKTVVDSKTFFEVTRNKKQAEIPKFKWYKKLFPEKYE